jgi:opacity protein-like surface antigen
MFRSSVLLRLVCLLISFACVMPPAASAQTTPQAAAPAADRWFNPYTILVVNANLNSGALLPGSFSVFALPEGSQRDREQFNISPANSLFGADFKFPDIERTKVGAKVDLTLRGSSRSTTRTRSSRSSSTPTWISATNRHGSSSGRRRT